MSETVIVMGEMDLDATLTSGQAFRWRKVGETWQGVVSGKWVELRRIDEGIQARSPGRIVDWRWLHDYFQTGTDLAVVLESFPQDEPLKLAAAACKGLRLLRQDPWECLASFILSSTKQIVQIQQIVELLCQRYGAPVITGGAEVWDFPTAQTLAALSESALRECKMGFRARYLLGTAKRIANDELQLDKLRGLPVEEARAALMELPGVGRKIADCVLLFAYGFPTAFPVDVWVMKALRELYFPKRRVSPRRLERFYASYFGPNAGYAQQYLFHYMRTRKKGGA